MSVFYEEVEIDGRMRENKEKEDISFKNKFSDKNEEAITSNQSSVHCGDYKKVVIDKIEKVVELFLAELSKGNPPSLVLANVNTWDNVSFHAEEGLQIIDKPALTKISFNSPTSVKKLGANIIMMADVFNPWYSSYLLGLLMKVLSIIYAHVQRNTFCTKRDMFYQDPQLFGNQACVDSVIDDVAILLQLPRWQLHVMATSKGLVIGDLQFTDVDGNYVDCNQHNRATPVPYHIQKITGLQTRAKFILTIEKDATFQKLLEEEFTRKMAPCIVITGKGFPDVNTRMLLKLLWNTFHIPTFCLVDADPHGLEIMAVYKFGSRSMCHESQTLAVPELKWLGILPSDIDRLCIPRKALMPLSKADVKKAQQLLTRSYITEQPNWKEEINTILKMKQKAEIQCLDSISHHFLVDIYLPNKLKFGGWI